METSGKGSFAAVIQDGAIHTASNRLHGGPQVDRDQLLEGLAAFTVVDRERVVNPLVEGHADVGRSGVLLNQRSAVNLTLDLERTGPTCVYHVTELGDLVLEITVDQVGRNHVLFED